MNSRQKITFSNFDSIKDVNPEEVTEAITEFGKRFQTTIPKKETLNKYLKLSKADQLKEKDGKCYALAIFKNNELDGKLQRKDSNVLSCTGIGIDVDNKDSNDMLTIDVVKNVFKEYFFILHTTHSSSKHQPRFRIIILFKEPVLPTKHANVFEHFKRELNNKIDSVVRNPSRVFFYPSCPSDQEDHYYYYINKGRLFDASVFSDSLTIKHDKKKIKKCKTIDCPEFIKVDIDKLKIGDKLKDSLINGYKEGDYTSTSEHSFACIKQLLDNDISLKQIFCIIANTEYAVNSHYGSDKTKVWEDVLRIADKIKNKNYAVKIGTEPYYQSPDYREPEEICNNIRNDIINYVNEQNNECNYSLGIKASAGIGKTEAVIKQIVKMVNNKDTLIEVYLPSNKLANEFRKRILKHDHEIAVQIIHGRDSPHAPDNHCLKKDAATCLSRASLGVSGLLCRNKNGSELCANHDTCNYLRQYKVKSSVVIYSHKHLFIMRNSFERSKKPNLIIIDESFFEASLNETEIKASTIDSLKLPTQIKESLSTNKPYDYLDLNCSDAHQLVLDELAQLKRQREELICKITPNTLPNNAKEISNKVKKYAKSIALLEAMVRDYERIRDHKKPIFLYCKEQGVSVHNKEKEILSWYCIEKHADLVRLKWKEKDGAEKLIPTVYIDADLNETITSVLFSRLVIRSYAAIRKARIWQLLSSNHRITDFYADDAETVISKVQKQINHFCKKLLENENIKNVLLVTYKSLLEDEKFTIPTNCETAYFGGLRGLDKFKDCNACIIVGRLQLPYDVIDRIAIGLWCDSNEELATKQHPVNEVRGYRIKNGKRLGMPVSVFKDERLQAIVEQKRECEILQALDRLRLMFNEKKKIVLILCKVPLDIDVEQVVFYKSATNKINKILRNAQHNVITLHAKTLYDNYPESFKSLDDVKKIITRWKELYLNDNNEALVYGINIKQTQYSFANKSGNPSYCLHRKKATKQTVISALEKIHNTDIINLKSWK